MYKFCLALVWMLLSCERRSEGQTVEPTLLCEHNNTHVTVQANVSGYIHYTGENTGNCSVNVTGFDRGQEIDITNIDWWQWRPEYCTRITINKQLYCVVIEGQPTLDPGSILRTDSTGSLVISIDNGSLSQFSLQYLPVTCDRFTTNISHGTLLAPPEPYTIHSIANVTCDRGYQTTVTSIVCQQYYRGGARWSSLNIKCVPEARCLVEAPQLPGATIRYEHPEATYYNADGEAVFRLICLSDDPENIPWDWGGLEAVEVHSGNGFTDNTTPTFISTMILSVLLPLLLIAGVISLLLYRRRQLALRRDQIPMTQTAVERRHGEDEGTKPRLAQSSGPFANMTNRIRRNHDQTAAAVYANVSSDPTAKTKKAGDQSETEYESMTGHNDTSQHVYEPLRK